MQTISVLVVDDDPDFLDLLSKQLQQIPNINISLARSPREAVRMITHNHYKLIVSDWALLSSTAPEVLNEADIYLESHKRFDEETKIPVMFMSGSEKVCQFQRLGLKHFEPVSFILKRCGPPMISSLAESMLKKFSHTKSISRRSTSSESSSLSSVS